MRLKALAPLVAAALLAPAPAALAAGVRVTISDGLVSISAQDATPREILAEWARVGQARIVNIERVSGGPVTLELANVPEAQALDTLLRSMSGYVAAPRAVASPAMSRYDRIFLLTTAAAAPPSRPALPPPPNQSNFRPAPVFVPPAPPDSVDDQPEPVPVVTPAPPPPEGAPRPTVFRTFPQDPPPDDGRQAQAPQQPQPPVSSPVPTAPAGVSRPGMVVPAPPQQQPGQSTPNNRAPR